MRNNFFTRDWTIYNWFYLVIARSYKVAHVIQCHTKPKELKLVIISPLVENGQYRILMNCFVEIIAWEGMDLTVLLIHVAAKFLKQTLVNFTFFFSTDLKCDRQKLYKYEKLTKLIKYDAATKIWPSPKRYLDENFNSKVQPLTLI